MKTHSALGDLLFPHQYRRKLLALLALLVMLVMLVMQPDKKMHLRELAR